MTTITKQAWGEQVDAWFDHIEHDHPEIIGRKYVEYFDETHGGLVIYCKVGSCGWNRSIQSGQPAIGDNARNL